MMIGTSLLDELALSSRTIIGVVLMHRPLRGMIIGSSPHGNADILQDPALRLPPAVTDLITRLPAVTDQFILGLKNMKQQVHMINLYMALHSIIAVYLFVLSWLKPLGPLRVKILRWSLRTQRMYHVQISVPRRLKTSRCPLRDPVLLLVIFLRYFLEFLQLYLHLVILMLWMYLR